MRNIKLIIEYDGKSFNGWQKQPDKLNIQGEIERAIEEITGEKVDLIASGRTDAGVHSFGQTANFKTNSNIPIDKLMRDNGITEMRPLYVGEKILIIDDGKEKFVRQTNYWI